MARLDTSQSARVRVVHDRPPTTTGQYVLYWMIGARRPWWNFALDHAIDRARELGKPLPGSSFLTGIRVSASAHVDLPRAECWEKLRDLERAKYYVPGVSDVVITTDAKEGVGASRVVTSSQAGLMSETVVAWQEQRGISLRLHRGDKGPLFPIRQATAHYALSDDGEGTLVTSSMDYSVGAGLLGRVVNWLFLRRILEQSMRNVALAVAEHWETDAPVSPERLEVLRSEAP